MANERWLPVLGWEDLYEVSDLGRVRSLRRRTASGWRGGRMLKPYINRSGYPQVVLCRGRPTQVRRMVHHLVLEAYDRPRPPGLEALHGPGGKTDARLVNLRWGTRSENIHDRVRDGQDNRGERYGLAKLTWAAVADIRARVAAGETQRALARQYGVHFSTVSMVVTGQTWVHVP